MYEYILERCLITNPQNFESDFSNRTTCLPHIENTTEEVGKVLYPVYIQMVFKSICEILHLHSSPEYVLYYLSCRYSMHTLNWSSSIRITTFSKKFNSILASDDPPTYIRSRKVSKRKIFLFINLENSYQCSLDDWPLSR